MVLSFLVLYLTRDRGFSAERAGFILLPVHLPGRRFQVAGGTRSARPGQASADREEASAPARAPDHDDDAPAPRDGGARRSPIPLLPRQCAAGYGGFLPAHLLDASL